LGYEKTANPVQILPRKVTAISQPVIDIALSVSIRNLGVAKLTIQDYAMICLLDSYEVVCFHHDTNFRIT